MQKKEAIGVAGAITLLMGVFFPIWEMPGRGDISLYEYDKGVALFTILMAILIMILVTRLKCKFVGTLNTITLFIIMWEKSIDIWQKKLDWIADKGGMALMNSHPDYMSFNGMEPGIEQYPAQYYTDFLEYIKSKYTGQYWNALPGEVARYCREHMKIQG